MEPKVTEISGPAGGKQALWDKTLQAWLASQLLVILASCPCQVSNCTLRAKCADLLWATSGTAPPSSQAGEGGVPSASPPDAFCLWIAIRHPHSALPIIMALAPQGSWCGNSASCQVYFNDTLALGT